jgi:hypothetical protein
MADYARRYFFGFVADSCCGPCANLICNSGLPYSRPLLFTHVKAVWCFEKVGSCKEANEEQHLKSYTGIKDTEVLKKLVLLLLKPDKVFAF